jgi:uncharacterized protein (DUF58 family)
LVPPLPAPSAKAVGGLPLRAPDAQSRDRATVRRKPTLLSPEELERYKDLLVFARTTVEGYYAGKHRSPYRGSSVEFADYKEYVPGDEVSRIDWRAYGRARRLFVRQYEAETDMVIYLLVDVSASMRYAGAGRFSKYIIAARIAAALAYLMIRQGDKAALGLFDDKLSRWLPAGGTRRHLHKIVSELELVEPASTTGIARALFECNPLFKKRGRIVILSDFWTDASEFLDALGPFLHRKFDLLLLQVLDPDELDLPTAAAARFKDMESNEEVQVELEEICASYRTAVRQQIDRLAHEASNRKVNHAMVNTRNPYLTAIEAYLGFRGVNAMANR